MEIRFGKGVGKMYIMLQNEKIIEQAKEIIKSSSKPMVYALLENGEKKKLRLFNSAQGRVCYFSKGSCRRGYPLAHLKIVKLIPIQKRKSEEAIWRDSWLKVKKRLEKSGLWQEILNNINIALDIGYDKIQEARKDYWKDRKGLSYEENQKRNTERIRQIDSRLVKKTKDGRWFENTEILWHIAYKAKVKKMYFGKYFTQEKLKLIAEAMRKRKSIHEGGRASYDVSFEYNAKSQKAWYSEEYRGCGNGHYYLALDSSHALFYEDD